MKKQTPYRTENKQVKPGKADKVYNAVLKWQRRAAAGQKKKPA